MFQVDLGNECKNASLKVKRGKGKILMSGLCSVAVPFNRNGTIKDAIKVRLLFIFNNLTNI